jgi:hypothetical protein
MFESARPAPMSRFARVVRRTTAIFALAFATSTYGCTEDGTTSNCPELPLYDLRADAALEPGIAEALAEAADAGCITSPGDAATFPDVVADTPNAPPDSPADAPTDSPVNTPPDGASDAPTDSPADAPKDGPVDAPRG